MVTLVTGANGFLGGYISRRLSEAGETVIEAGRPEVRLPSTEFDELLVRSRPDTVVHCAGPASVPFSFEDPVADLQGSAGVLATILDRLRRVDPPPRLLLLSSAAVYGEPSGLPVDERAELAPLSPYGFHRMACELVVREFNEVYGVPAATMRIFSAYGEGLQRQIVWDICRKAIQDERVELSGTGLESRDFIHAHDVADAAHAIFEGGSFTNEAYNVGSGRETTIRELALLLVAELGLDADAVLFDGKRRPG